MSPESGPDADREYLLNRLQSLRTIVPVFAKELASTRRQVAGLREENRGLVERLRQLERQHAATDGAIHSDLGPG